MYKFRVLKGRISVLFGRDSWQIGGISQTELADSNPIVKSESSMANLL